MEERALLKPSGQYGSFDRLGPKLLARAKTESSVHREKGRREREREGRAKRDEDRTGAGKSRKGGNRAERGREEKRAGRKEGGLT